MFISKFSRLMSALAIEYMTTKYLKDARSAGHQCIRYGILWAHQMPNGTDLKTVQETLGHASLATTSNRCLVGEEGTVEGLQEHGIL